MSIDLDNLRETLIDELCNKLSDEEIEKLLKIIHLKVNSGHSAYDVGLQLVSAAAEAIHIMYPDLEADVVVSIAEDVSDALVDRVIEIAGLEFLNDVSGGIPHEQLN